LIELICLVWVNSTQTNEIFWALGFTVLNVIISRAYEYTNTSRNLLHISFGSEVSLLWLYSGTLLSVKPCAETQANPVRLAWDRLKIHWIFRGDWNMKLQNLAEPVVLLLFLKKKRSLFPWSVKEVNKGSDSTGRVILHQLERERSCWGNCVCFFMKLLIWLTHCSFWLWGIAIVLVLESVESNLKWCRIIEMWFAAYVLQCNTYQQAL